jgi:[ribosomal protein S18]-alanine N-acetyltransferase
MRITSVGRMPKLLLRRACSGKARIVAVSEDVAWNFRFRIMVISRVSRKIDPEAYGIRLARREDVPAMISLEGSCPSAAHWSEKQYRQMFEESVPGTGRLAWVAERSGAEPGSGELDGKCTSLAGFVVARQISREWELENIVVAADFRRQGLGQHLLAALLARVCETDSASVFLEVRESNTPARRFYERAGFEAAGRRKSYYQNPLEDALLYHRIVKS